MAASKKTRRYTPEERAAHVKAFKESGLSQVGYARVNGLTTQSLMSWQGKGKHPVKTNKTKKKAGKRSGRNATATGKFTTDDSLDLTQIANDDSPLKTPQQQNTMLRAVVKSLARML
jgi:transposase-like protein